MESEASSSTDLTREVNEILGIDVDNIITTTTDVSCENFVLPNYDENDCALKTNSNATDCQKLDLCLINNSLITDGVDNFNVNKINDVDFELLENNRTDNFDDSFTISTLEEDVVFSSSDEDFDNLQLEEIENDSFNEDTSSTVSAGVTEKRKNEGKQNLTRKRLCRSENWKKNVSKKAANLGMEYVSLSTKKIVPARTIQRTCGPGCKFKCQEKISETARLAFFTEFWSIPEHSRKYDFILRHVSEKFNKESEDEKTKRNYTRTYTMNERDKNIVVCKSMFLNSLSISRQMIDTAFKKLKNGESNLTDKRGQSKRRPRAVAEEKTKTVIDHINMFPRIESHYTRKDSSREYLEENLSLSKMYLMYVDLMKETGKPIATKHHYCDIFNTRFNIGFFKPKKDLCDKCEGYKNAVGQEKEKLEEQYTEHVKNKEASRNCKDQDKILAKENKENFNMIFFDFEKVLTTPRSEASCLYYKRKLSVYNFTVYDIARHEGFCYVWSENEAKKGSNEVSSCLLHYIEKRASEGITDFFLWSDNCPGQNRNKQVFAMILYASCKFNVNIKFSFLEVGHTQNEGDSVHSTIERHAKGQKIYTLEDWCKIIETAKIAKPYYQVIKVNYNMIYDFKDLAQKLNWSKKVLKKNKSSTIDLPVSKLKQVLALKENPNQLQFKTFFELNFETLITRKEKANANVKKYTLQKAYSSDQGLPLAKLNDLKTLCQKNIIPPEYHDYYNKFQAKKSTVGHNSDEEN